MRITRQLIGSIIIVGIPLILSGLLLIIGLPLLAQFRSTEHSSPSTIIVTNKHSQSDTSRQVVQVIDTPDSPILQKQSVQGNYSQISITEDQGLQLKLITDKQKYVLGEPILITLTLRNVLNTAIPIYSVLEAGYGLVWTQVRYEHDEFKNYSGPGFGTVDYFLGAPSSLPPGKKLVEHRKILYEPLAENPRNFYALHRSGNYQLRMVLDGIVPDERLTTAEVQIEIVEPVGSDKQIWRLLQTEEAASFLHNGYVPNPKQVIANFTTILKQYPNSVYAQHLQIALNSIPQPVKAETAVQAVDASISPIILTINEQLYIVRSLVKSDIRSASRTNEETLNAILDAIQLWVNAWNNRDIEHYVQSYSFTTTFRQKWEKGPGNLNHDAIQERLPGTFDSKGLVTVDIIGFNIGEEEVILDVVGLFESGSGQGDVFDTMRFTKDDDNIWRLVSPGWQ